MKKKVRIIDCGDNSCNFAPQSAKGGMRTNGGCRCFEEAGFSRSSVQSAHQMLPKYLDLLDRVKELEKELQYGGDEEGESL